MNLNENLVLPENFIRSVTAKCLDKLSSRYYPSELNEGEMYSLKVEIAKYCKCSPEMVCLGDGSDQLIDLLFRMKLRKAEDELVTVDPTFSLYALMARRIGARVVQVPVKPFVSSSQVDAGFALNEHDVIRACKSKSQGRARVLALASPNNPTGVQYPLDQVKGIVESLPDVTILLDEAYVEYARYEATRLLGTCRNLIIMRTFSKAFALASHRLGYFLSSGPDFVRSFEDDFQYPFPVAGFGVLVATELLRRRATVLEWANRTVQLRSELLSGIEGMGKTKPNPPFLSGHNSEGNFILVQSPIARKVAFELLKKYKIAVKLIEKIGPQSGFLRITVGTKQLNARLLYALRRIIAARSA